MTCGINNEELYVENRKRKTAKQGSKRNLNKVKMNTWTVTQLRKILINVYERSLNWSSPYHLPSLISFLLPLSFPLSVPLVFVLFPQFLRPNLPLFSHSTIRPTFNSSLPSLCLSVSLSVRLSVPLCFLPSPLPPFLGMSVHPHVRPTHPFSFSPFYFSVRPTLHPFVLSVRSSIPSFSPSIPPSVCPILLPSVRPSWSSPLLSFVSHS